LHPSTPKKKEKYGVIYDALTENADSSNNTKKIAKKD